MTVLGPSSPTPSAGTDLGALPPGETSCSNAYQVNASGEIVGFSENGELDPLAGINSHAPSVGKTAKSKTLDPLEEIRT